MSEVNISFSNTIIIIVKVLFNSTYETIGNLNYIYTFRHKILNAT
jgi:hypothetical protein